MAAQVSPRPPSNQQAPVVLKFNDRWPAWRTLCFDSCLHGFRELLHMDEKGSQDGCHIFRVTRLD